MAKLKLRDGFKNIPVGDAQTLEIKKVKFDTKFMKVVVTFSDGKGGTCSENFNLVDDKGNERDVPLGILSTIYKCAVGGETGDEFDPRDMEGYYVVADVYEQVVKDEDGNETNRYVHVKNFKEVEAEAEADDDDDDFGDLFD